MSLPPRTKAKNGAAGHTQLPFETWRPIFQDVYATRNSISHPPSPFEISPLHSRLNVYRNLALVSKSWRTNARDVFFEELQAHTADALKGMIQAFSRERMLALAVSRISFSFWDFRCSASQPRRPRPLRHDADSEVVSPSGTRKVPDWKTVHRRDARSYRPSTTCQGSHWMRWQADTAQVLSMCSSLSEVDIVFTSSTTDTHYPYVYSRIAYGAFFPSPDLTNKRILEGLMCSPNLRRLHLTDPTPLKHYGPELAHWTRLKNVSITLTQPFEELTDTAFMPPKSLISFCFHDNTSGRFPWPLASDLARCTNLQVLDLAVKTLRNEQTFKAIMFLCVAYQHSLRELTLEIKAGVDQSTFDRIFTESGHPLHFRKLERLRLLGSNYDTSIFSSFKTEVLTYVEVRWLSLEPFTGAREEKWSKGLGYPSLSKLQHLVINSDDPDRLRKEALRAVCERLGIQVVIGREPRLGPESEDDVA